MSDKYTLNYFALGGRADVIRMALTSNGIEFEDEQVAEITAFAGSDLKKECEYGSLPALRTPEGKLLVQTNAILRYIGTKHDLYPTDDNQAYEVDSIIDYCDDVTKGIIPIFFAPDSEAKKAAWTKFLTEDVPKAFALFEARLERIGTGYMTTDKATIGDYKAWSLLTSFLDHEYLRDTLAPHIESFTKVKEYIERGRAENAAHYERTAG